MKPKTNIISIFVFSMFLLITMNCQSQKPEKRETQQVTKTDTTQAKLRVFNFEQCRPGILPDGWETAMTGKGTLGKWVIATDKSKSGETKVLAQTSMKNFGYHFDVAVAKNIDYKDIVLSVKFKAIKGNEDRGGGPVWRYRDANNYYICRANPLEDNFRVYKVIDGNRKQSKGYNLPITSGQWHTIKVEHIGTHIKCYYDSQLYLEVDDNTFIDSGKIGVWTKADSYCYFDDIAVE
ncbi:MAG: hypothetical protein ACE5NG_13965, partial [bacterium]